MLTSRSLRRPPFLAVRIVDQPGLPVEHHRRPLRRIEWKPLGQTGVARIAAPSERDPRLAHSLSECIPLSSGAGHVLHVIDVVEDERKLHAVHRPKPASPYGR